MYFPQNNTNQYTESKTMFLFQCLTEKKLYRVKGNSQNLYQ